MSVRRRRRRDYTPEQEAARVRLHKAETWVKVLSYGIAEGLKRELYCTDGIRELINLVDVKLVEAADALEFAHAEHDKAFSRPGRAASIIVVSRSGANPVARRKAKPSDPIARIANPVPRRKVKKP